jgi:nucleotide-binding universal stress UspA family protein
MVALDWALAEGKLRGAGVEVVHAFMPNLSEIWVDEQAGPREAAELLRNLVEPAVAGHPGVDVTTRAMEGPSAGTLLEAAAGANLLVVGTRGKGGFAGLLLGSVSQQIVHHATCPVVVVPTGGSRA